MKGIRFVCVRSILNIPSSRSIIVEEKESEKLTTLQKTVLPQGNAKHLLVSMKL
jgi:hypothetical protein